MHTIQVNPAAWPTSAVEAGGETYQAGELYEVDETTWEKLAGVEIYLGKIRPAVPAFVETKPAKPPKPAAAAPRKPRAKPKTTK